jgi:general secretion pathway protein C
MGYKLKAIELTQVIFTKSGKEHVLSLAKSSSPSYSSSIERIGKDSVDINEAKVSRADIKSYSSNPSKIWKDIAIVPVKKDGKVQGFKINRIKAGSKMAQLGLQKGDIIIRANNVKLSSFNDAIKLYKNIDKLETIALVVLRNNEEKEIIYEIN